jgi:hypothetical protein
MTLSSVNKTVLPIEFIFISVQIGIQFKTLNSNTFKSQQFSLISRLFDRYIS